MSFTERLALLVDARAEGAVREIKKLAREAGRTDDAAKKLEARGQAIGTAFKIGAGVVAGAALIKLAELSGEAIDAAAALGEQQSKTNVVFAQAADKVREFGRNAATNLNLSEREALSAASTFGQFFDAAGLATDAVADMSMATVKLAADMASFQDADPSEVLENLRSGLSGESEPLRKFGVFLNETAVAAKAAELGLQGVNGKLTDGEKIQARYAIIMEQTAKQQGDLARTADSLSNKQRQATAMAENASAALGEGLIPAQLALTNAFIDATPAITGVARATGNLVEGYSSMPGPMQALVGGTSVLGAGFLLLAPRIKETRQAVKDLGVEAPRTARALSMIGKAAAAFTVIQILDASIESLSRSMDDALPGAEALAGRLIDMSEGKASSLGKEFDDFAESIRNFQDEGSTQKKLDFIPDVIGLVPGIESSEEALRHFIDRAASLDAALASIAATSAPNAQAAFEALAEQLGLSASEQKVLLDQLPTYTEALAGQANQARLAATATNDLGGATDGLIPPTTEATEAQKKLAEAQAKLRGEARGTAQSFVGLGESASDAKVSLNSWIEDMQEQAQALRNFTANARTAADRGLRQGLIAALQEMGPAGATRLQQLANASKTEIGKANQAWRAGQDAIREYVKLKVPPKKPEVDITGALASLNTLEQRLKEATRDRQVRIYSKVFGGTGKNPVPPGVRAPKETPRASSFMPDDIRGSGGGFTGRAGGGLASLDTMLQRDAEATKGHARDVDDNRRKLREHTQELRDAKQSLKADVADSFNEEIFKKGGLVGAMAQLQTNAASASAMEAALQQASKLGLKGGAFQALATSSDLQTAQELDTREEVAAFMALFNSNTKAGKSLGSFAGNEVYGKKISDSLDKQNRSTDRLDRTLGRLPAEVRAGVREGMDHRDRALRARL